MQLGSPWASLAVDRWVRRGSRRACWDCRLCWPCRHSAVIPRLRTCWVFAAVGMPWAWPGAAPEKATPPAKSRSSPKPGHKYPSSVADSACSHGCGSLGRWRTLAGRVASDPPAKRSSGSGHTLDDLCPARSTDCVGRIGLLMLERWRRMHGVRNSSGCCWAWLVPRPWQRLWLPCSCCRSSNSPQATSHRAGEGPHDIYPFSASSPIDWWSLSGQASSGPASHGMRAGLRRCAFPR